MLSSGKWCLGGFLAFCVVAGIGREALLDGWMALPSEPDSALRVPGAPRDAAALAGTPSSAAPGTTHVASPQRDVVHDETGALDLHTVTVVDGAGHPLRDVACYPLDTSAHPRRLVDAEFAQYTGVSGEVALGGGLWLFDAQGRIAVEALVDSDRTVALVGGSGAVVELRDFFTDRPLVDESLVFTRFGLFAGYRNDPWSAERSVARAGFHGLHRATTGPQGQARVEGIAPDESDSYMVHPCGSLLLEPRARVAAEHVVLRARRYTVVEVRAGAAEVLAVAVVGRRALAPQRIQPDLWSAGVDSPAELIVLHDLEVQSGQRVACRALVDGVGLVGFELDAKQLAARDRLQVELAPRADGSQILAELEWFGDGEDPLEAVLQCEDGTELALALHPGASRRVPPGVYRVHDALGRTLSPATVELGVPGAQQVPQRRSPLVRCDLHVTTADGLEPELLMARCDGSEPVFVRGRGEAWLAPGACRLFVDFHGAVDVEIPASAAGERVEVRVEVALEPERRWYHDVPLGERIVELATDAGIVLDPHRLDVAALRALQLQADADLAAIRARPDPMEAIQGEMRRQLSRETAEHFDDSAAFWARVEEVDASFSKQLKAGRMVVFEERGGEGEPWQGLVRIFSEAEHPELLQRAREAYAERRGRSKELKAVREELQRSLLDAIHRAAVQ